MKIKVLKETPRNIKEFPVENEYNLSKEEVLTIGTIRFKIIESKDFTNLEKISIGMQKKTLIGTDLYLKEEIHLLLYFGTITNLIKSSQQKINSLS